MKINRKKYELARARKCISSKDIVDSGIPSGTLCAILNGRNAKPETIGKIARAIGVDVTEIIDL